MSERANLHFATSEGAPAKQDQPALRDFASSMLSLGARLVTIVCTPGQPTTLRYFWDADGTLHERAFTAPAEGVPSIADLTPAADWIEREVHDYYAVPFLGRADLAPLMLRPGDRPGVFANPTSPAPVEESAGERGSSPQESAR